MIQKPTIARGVSAAMVCLVFLPIVYLLWRVLGSDAPFAFLARAPVWTLLGRSLLLASSVAFFALILAALFVRIAISDSPLKRFFHITAIAPLALPSFVGASAYLSALAPQGLLGFLQWPTPSGYFGATFVITLFTFSLAYLPLRTAALGIDQDLYEAAQVLGMNKRSAFFCAARSSVLPAVFTGGALVFLYALSEFGAVSMLRFNSFPRVIYSQFQNAFDRGAAASSSLFLTLVVVLFLIANERFVDSKAKRARAKPLLIGRSFLAEALACALTLLTLVIPLLALLQWALKAEASAYSTLVEAASTSLILGAAAALLTLFCAWFPARLAERSSGRFIIRLLDFGFALPGIVVALGFTFFSLMVVRSLYQTRTLLIFAYVILFLALALSSLRAALAQIPTDFEESAQTLGAGTFSRFKRVLLPLSTRGMGAAFLLVMISVMKELPATLLLIPVGQRTLATSLWSFSDEALYAEAAVVAIVLVAISSLAVALLSWLEDKQ